MTVFTTLVSAILLVTVALPQHAQSSPAARRSELDVFNPTITSPTANMTWHIGSTAFVTWDTSSIPPEKRNSTSMILLGHLTHGSEHLDVDNPLASGFPLGPGKICITVPEVPVRHNYIIALFGDSGNISPKFTITASPPATTTQPKAHPAKHCTP